MVAEVVVAAHQNVIFIDGGLNMKKIMMVIFLFALVSVQVSDGQLIELHELDKTLWKEVNFQIRDIWNLRLVFLF